MCQCTNKDQTPEGVIKFTKDNNINVFSSYNDGIGMFVIPAPEIGIMETKVILVDNLSYTECAKRGATCDSFKWIPKGYSFSHGEEGKTFVINSVNDIRAIDDLCDNACTGGCPMGCHCYSGWTRCKPNRYAD
jgi:hypothetical protein